MGGNGKAVKLEVKKDIFQMVITSEKDKPIHVGFPFLGDKLVTYGFLKLAEKTLDAHYAKIDEENKPKILQPAHELQRG